MSNPYLPRAVTGAIDGTNAAFATDPYEAGTLRYQLNGITRADPTETSPTTGAFTLPAPPEINDDLLALARFP